MQCKYEGCEKEAAQLAMGRDRFTFPESRISMEIDNYCAAHASVVASYDDPEYIVDCPNCGCKFGVN